MWLHIYGLNTLTKKLSFINSGLNFVNKVRGCRGPSCGTIMNVRENKCTNKHVYINRSKELSQWSYFGQSKINLMDDFLYMSLPG